MKNKNKIIDHLPDEFATEEEAGEFWDTHPFTDYLEDSTPVEVSVQLHRRYFAIDEDLVELLEKQAKTLKTPVHRLVTEILKEKLLPLAS